MLFFWLCDVYTDIRIPLKFVQSCFLYCVVKLALPYKITSYHAMIYTLLNHMSCLVNGVRPSLLTVLAT